MPKGRRQQKGDREAGYALIVVLFVIGIGLVMIGHLVGTLLILASVYLIFVAFPSVREGFASLIRMVQKWMENRKVRKRDSQMRIETTEPEPLQRSEFVEEIIRRIKGFRPYKRPTKEAQLEDMLMQYLRVYFPSLRTQLYFENTRIDGQINEVGIELKYQPNEADFDRLFGQVEKYSRHLDYVIVVVAYERSRESVTHFRNRLQRRNLDSQIAVISIP